MAASKKVRNQLEQFRYLLYWIAQQQDTCPECDEALLPNEAFKDLVDITYDHASGSYDHQKGCESGGELMGGTLMHRSCHKSMTMSKNKVWEHRTNVKAK